MGKEGGFGVVRDFEKVLGDRFCRIRATPDFDQFRVMHELPGQPLDFAGKGGGKEQRLPLAGQKPDDLADGRDKSHIEHSVGFVKNQEFEGPKALFPSANQIEKPSRGGHSQIDALLEGSNLGTFADASKDRGNAERQMAGVVMDVFFNLNDQFPGGNHD
jgi:hypothetical protein